MALSTVLHHSKPELVLGLDYHKLRVVVLDNSRNNHDLARVNIDNPEEFSRYIQQQLDRENSVIGIGKYNEDRVIYDHSNLFAGGERRTIHLGIDLFVVPQTPVRVPFDGRINSFHNNAGVGDYGPTIIVEHSLGGIRFFTLYGHLSLESIGNLEKGQRVSAGQTIGFIGNYPVNGNWPPHLHFQIITDMMGKSGDYPGVTSIKEREKYLALCPDPNLILQIPQLVEPVQVTL